VSPGLELLEDTAIVKPGTVERQSRLELELTEERAAALRRISQTLESLIAQLHALRVSIRETPSPDLSRDGARYQELRDRAVLYRWYLDVQRESLGLRPDDRLNEFYAVPPLLENQGME